MRSPATTLSAYPPKYDENLAQPEVIAAFNAHVEEILSETTSPGMSQLEIALSLHDYLGHHRTIVSAAFAQSFAPSVQL